MFLWVIIGLYAISVMIQAHHWWRICSNYTQTLQAQSSAIHYPNVSIVVAARNEADNLPNLIPALLSQDYTNYEVIVVDDGSTDRTQEVLNTYQDNKLKIISQAHAGKKAALSKGIDAALGTWIVCTDADCYPNGSAWLQALLKDNSQKDVILGYGPYQRINMLPARLQRYETWYIASQYLSAALDGNAYMGVGRNLAFRKSVFENENGYERHQEVKSGDDDLFIGGLAAKTRIGISVIPAAWMYSRPETTWIDLWKQKRRHLTTAPKYKPVIQIKLMIVFLSHVLTYLLPILLAYLASPLFLLMIVLRWIYLLAMSKRSMRMLDVQELWLSLPLLDLILVLYYSLHGLAMPWQKKNW